MNTLDDVYDLMRQFRITLGEFDESLAESFTELERHHEHLEGMWQDQMAQRYWRAYEPFAETMKTYIQGDALRFEEFLDTKLRILDQYLSGA